MYIILLIEETSISLTSPCWRVICVDAVIGYFGTRETTDCTLDSREPDFDELHGG